jgi:hypothetical protein
MLWQFSKNNKVMRRILITFLIIIAIVALILIGGYLYIRYMPDKSITKQTVDFSLTASNLAEEYENNPEASDRKYIDRVIEVKGTINEISTDQNNSVVFILKENGSSAGVLCTLNEKSIKKVKRYKKGDTITLKGTCSGMLFEVVLNKCIIVDL